MKIQIDDPRLTHYLLGECTNAERLEIEQALRDQPELQTEIDSLRSLSKNLRQELQNEPIEGLKPDQIMAIERHIQSRRKIIRWDFKEARLPWEIAISLAACLSIGWFTFDRLTPSHSAEERALATDSTIEIPLSSMINSLPLNQTPVAAPSQEIPPPWEQPPLATLSDILPNEKNENTHKSILFTEMQMALLSKEQKERSIQAKVIPDGFLTTESHTIASIALESHRRSYEALKKSIETGRLPLPEEVQIDSILNAFKVNDAPPTGEAPYKVHIQITTCPWNPARALARIALIAQKGASNESRILAEKVQWHFELNPQRIASYRILGYDDAPEKIGAVLPSSQTISLNFQRVVLLEIIPTEESKQNHSTQPWLTVEIQHQTTAEQIIQKSYAYQGEIEILNRSSTPDLQFAAAIAQFGMLLKKTPEAEPSQWSSTLTLARQGALQATGGERQEFVMLIEKAQKLNYSAKPPSSSAPK